MLMLQPPANGVIFGRALGMLLLSLIAIVFTTFNSKQRLMAVSKQTCFYCGLRSKKHDVGLKQWECESCLAMNYRDRYGKPTDPPLSRVSPASSPPPTIQWAHRVAEPIFHTSDTPSRTADSPFCADCLRNQNIFASLIAEYDPDHMDGDPSRPFSPDRKFIRYKKELYARYLQVCSDCQRGVDDRIRSANRMARGQVLRQKLDRTRVVQVQSKSRSWVESCALCGGVLYWLATGAQILVCFRGLLDASMSAMWMPEVTEDISRTNEPLSRTWPIEAASVSAWILRDSPAYLESFRACMPSLTTAGLVLTSLSIWWNPYYRNMIRGFDTHIHGFLDWYKYQIILLSTRVIFARIMGKGQFANSNEPATIGANIFMLGLTILVASISRWSIKVDLRRLFPPDVGHGEFTEDAGECSDEKPTATSSAYSSGGMMDALNGYSRPGTRQAQIPVQTFSQQRNDQSILYPSSSFVSAQRQASLSPSPLAEPKVSLAAMDEHEAADYLMRGTVPARMRSSNSPDVHADDDMEMEWTPSQKPSGSEFALHARQIPASIRQPSQPVQKDAFWFKVPPKPLGPAQKLWQPFKKPIFQPASEEKKQSFFRSLTTTSSNITVGDNRELFTNDDSQDRPSPRDAFAQPKFFARGAFESTGLEELMEKAFTLASGETPAQRSEKRGWKSSLQGTAVKADVPHSSNNGAYNVGRDTLPSRGQITGEWKAHLVAVIVIAFAFLVWDVAFKLPPTETQRIAIGILTICTIMAVRTLANNTVGAHMFGARSAIAALLGGVEAAFGVVLCYEIALSGLGGDGLKERGALFLGGSLVHQMVFLLW